MNADHNSDSDLSFAHEGSQRPEKTHPLIWVALGGFIGLAGIMFFAVSSIFMGVQNAQMAAEVQDRADRAAVVKPLEDQREAKVVTRVAKGILQQEGIVAGEGKIESIYAVTPERLTIVTSYTTSDAHGPIRAVAEDAWDSGLDKTQSIKTVEVMVKDADGLNRPMYQLDADEV